MRHYCAEKAIENLKKKRLLMSAPHPYVIPTKTGWIVLCMPFNLGRVRYVSNNVIKVSCLIFHRNCDGKAWILKFPILLFFTLFTPFRGQISILDIMFIYKVWSTHHKLQNDGSHMNVSESWDFFIERALHPFWPPLKRGSGIAQLEPHFSDVIQTLTDHLKQKNRFIQKNPTKLHKGLHYMPK